MAARYFRIWRRAVALNFSVLAASRIDFLMFVPGKLLRMGFFVVLPLTLLQYSPTIAGYDQGQVLVFFSMMNVIDVFSTIIFLRGLNLMPRYVSTGEFDAVLVKPISPLFWTMFRVVDFFDVLTAPAAIAYVVFAITQLSRTPTTAEFLTWLGFTLLSIVLSFCIVLTLAAISFVTTETENAHFLYRDSMNIARFPPEVLPSIARATLSTVLPVLVIVSVPSLALMGRLSWPVAVGAIVVAAVWVGIATFAWRAGLRRYTSASS